MSVKHIKDYYLKITNDYHMMNETLKEMEKAITDDNLEIAKQNIPMIKQQVAQLKENYLRISYIMFLLNMPNKKDKQRKYIKQETNTLNNIPPQHQLEGVLQENKQILDNLMSLVK